jgi:hypothetical protein
MADMTRLAPRDQDFALQMQRMKTQHIHSHGEEEFQELVSDSSSADSFSELREVPFLPSEGHLQTPTTILKNILRLQKSVVYSNLSVSFLV